MNSKQEPKQKPQSPYGDPYVMLATGLGVGASPAAPGTLGCLWGIPITVGLSFVTGWWPRAVLIAVGCMAGVVVCDRAARRLGSKDPSSVVWDEFATMPIVFLWVPVTAWRMPLILALGFVLHRIFDISKLPPVNMAERLPGGWGIMLDDVVAAFYAAGVLWLITYLGWLSV